MAPLFFSDLAPPGQVAAGLLHSDLAPPAGLDGGMSATRREGSGAGGMSGWIVGYSRSSSAYLWGRDGVEVGAVRRDPLGLPAGGARGPGAGPQVRRAPPYGAAGDRLAVAAGPQEAGAAGAGAGGRSRVDRRDAARGPRGAAQAAAYRSAGLRAAAR